jgi:hypothetical protein
MQWAFSLGASGEGGISTGAPSHAQPATITAAAPSKSAPATPVDEIIWQIPWRAATPLL